MGQAMSMDIYELRNKAYNGRIQPEELAEVIDKIQKYYEHSTDENIDTLLRIVGYAGCFSDDWERVISEYRGLIEKFSNFSRGPSTSAIALDILCNDWNLTTEYIPLIKTYIQGMEWDEGEDVRIMAMFIAGDYVKKCGDKGF